MKKKEKFILQISFLMVQPWNKKAKGIIMIEKRKSNNDKKKREMKDNHYKPKRLNLKKIANFVRNIDKRRWITSSTRNGLRKTRIVPLLVLVSFKSNIITMPSNILCLNTILPFM